LAGKYRFSKSGEDSKIKKYNPPTKWKSKFYFKNAIKKKGNKSKRRYTYNLKTSTHK